MVGGECVKQQFGMKCMYASKHRNVDKSHASSSIFKNNLKFSKKKNENLQKKRKNSKKSENFQKKKRKTSKKSEKNQSYFQSVQGKL